MKISLIVLFHLLSFNLTAQTLFEKILTPYDPLESDYFGTEVATGDGFLFVSSLRYSNPSENSVYVYKFIDNDYIYYQKIFPQDTQTLGSLFGVELNYSNGKLFVGARNNRINNLQVGAVYVFEFVLDQWVEQQKIIPPGPYSSSEYFGTAISEFNGYLLIGAMRDEWNGVRCGKAYLYQYINANYELIHEFIPGDAKEGQAFGYSVFLNDNLLIIGSSLDSTSSGIFSGSFYTYTLEESIWTLNKKYIPNGNEENLGFGCAIVANENFVCIGTTDVLYYNQPGKVYIYKYNHPSLELFQIIESGNGYWDDRFGISLSINGDSLLVSAISDTVGDYYPGSVYIFSYNGNNWEKKNRIYPSNEENAIDFGGKTVLTQSGIFIGAKLTKINGIRSGAVYIYTPKPLSVENQSSIPNSFIVYQNYPNPFNSKTQIKYYIPQDGKLIIKVYNILGKEVTTLLEENKNVGEYAVEMDLNGSSSGVYFYKSEFIYKKFDKINHAIQVKKAVYLK